MLVFDEAALINLLNSLPMKKCTAFAASCCERMVPNYRAFSVWEGWGDPALLRTALDSVWSFLAGQTFPRSQVQKILQACEAITPDMDDFSSVFRSTALYAAIGVAYTVEYCLDPQSQLIAYVAGGAVEALSQYLSVVADPETQVHTTNPIFETWIDQSPLIQTELQYQKRDLEVLQTCKVVDLSLIDQLRQSSSMAGLQPFLRGMVKGAN